MLTVAFRGWNIYMCVLGLSLVRRSGKMFARDDWTLLFILGMGYMRRLRHNDWCLSILSSTCANFAWNNVLYILAGLLASCGKQNNMKEVKAFIACQLRITYTKKQQLICNIFQHVFFCQFESDFHEVSCLIVPSSTFRSRYFTPAIHDTSTLPEHKTIIVVRAVRVCLLRVCVFILLIVIYRLPASWVSIRNINGVE